MGDFFHSSQCYSAIYIVKITWGKRDWEGKKRGRSKQWAFGRKPLTRHIKATWSCGCLICWALHWFDSPSNWLRSTPQSPPEAFITYCRASDCTQGFLSSVCKCTARISGGICPWGAAEIFFSSLGFEPLHSIICPVFCRCYVEHKALLFPLPIQTHNSVISSLHKAAGP